MTTTHSKIDLRAWAAAAIRARNSAKWPKLRLVSSTPQDIPAQDPDPVDPIELPELRPWGDLTADEEFKLTLATVRESRGHNV